MKLSTQCARTMFHICYIDIFFSRNFTAKHKLFKSISLCFSAFFSGFQLGHQRYCLAVHNEHYSFSLYLYRVPLSRPSFVRTKLHESSKIIARKLIVDLRISAMKYQINDRASYQIQLALMSEHIRNLTNAMTSRVCPHGRQRK